MSTRIDFSAGCTEISIAVLDGPIDLDHPCFVGASIDAPSEHGLAARSRCPATAHGTHVASIIFGQHDSPVSGIAPRCRGMSLPVFGEGSASSLSCSQLDLARAIVTALDRRAMIINISGGQLDFSREPEDLLRRALDQCEEQGVLVVAAAGNDGCDCPHTPASYPTVLAVGAVAQDGSPLAMTNWSSAYLENGLLAPGENILGAEPGGGVSRRTGTSFATPIVSACAALLLCEQIARSERPDPLAVRSALLASAAKNPRRATDPHRRMAGCLDVAGASEILKQRRNTMNLNEPAFHNVAVTAGIPAPTSAMRANAISPSGIDVAFPGAVASGGAPVRQVEASCGDGPCTCKDSGGGCSCGGAPKAAASPQRQLVYALGHIGFDFGTESRRDSFYQFFNYWLVRQKRDKASDADIVEYLQTDSNEETERLIWTLNVGTTPVYAITPAGALAFLGYEKLLKLFAAQIGGTLPLVAVPGVAGSSVRLMSGETLPLLVPATKGLLPWDFDEVINQWLAKSDAPKTAGKKGEVSREELLRRFLNDFVAMITRKHRNLGLSGAERALNYAATNVFRVLDGWEGVRDFHLALDDIDVGRSAACRSGSECYDIRLKMFVPSDTTAAIQVIQWTVDVSDIIPVNIGNASFWSERPKG